MHSQAALFFSKKETDKQPLDIASRPIAPDPAKQSKNETLAKSIFQLTINMFLMVSKATIQIENMD